MKDLFRNAAIEPAAVVDLVISPALFKRGNNDGADYLSTDCCVKRRVLCNAAMFFPQSSPLVDMPAGASSPQENVGHPHAVQVVKEEDMSEDAGHRPHQSSYTLIASKLGSVEHGHVVPQPDTQVENKPEISKRGTTPGQKSRKSIGACGYEKQSSQPQPRGSGGRKTQKRRRESGGSDDELDEDYVPGSPSKPTPKRLTTRRQLRQSSA